MLAKIWTAICCILLIVVASYSLTLQPVAAQSEACSARAYYSTKIGSENNMCTKEAPCETREQAIDHAENVCSTRGFVYRIEPIGDNGEDIDLLPEVRWVLPAYVGYETRVAFFRLLIRFYPLVGSIVGLAVGALFLFGLRSVLSRSSAISKTKQKEVA